MILKDFLAMEYLSTQYLKVKIPLCSCLEVFSLSQFSQVQELY
jgi:hypothetical protein